MQITKMNGQMGVTNSHQKVSNQQSGGSQPAFGMNFNFSKGFSKEASRLADETQDVLIKTLKSVEKDVADDNSTITFFADSFKLENEVAGKKDYPIKLEPESLKQGVMTAYQDIKEILGLPKYAEELSKKHGVNLSFSSDNAYFITEENNTGHNFKRVLDTIAERMSTFKDKEDYNVVLSHGGSNTYNLSIANTKNGQSAKPHVFLDRFADLERLNSDIEGTYLYFKSSLGDTAPNVIRAEKAEREVAFAQNAEAKLNGFKSKLEQAYGGE